MKITATLLAVVALWWFCYPAPIRTIPEQFTEAERRDIRRAIKRYGNFPIVEEAGRRVMITSYGRVKL